MVWKMECGGNYIIKGQKVFGRKIFIEPANMFDIIDRFNNTDVYFTNFLYNEEDQNKSDLIGPLYIDLDGDIHDEESYNNVRIDTLMAISYLKTHLHVPKEYIRIFFSGNKGFHLFVPYNVFGIKPCKDLNDKYKIIAKEIKTNTLHGSIDTRIYDKKRLIRVPHSINGKTGLYKVPLIEKDLRKFTLKEMIEYATEDKEVDIYETEIVQKAKIAFESITTVKEVKRVKKDTKLINPSYEIPICIKNIYSEGAMEGQRNNTLVVLASAILQKGKDLDDVIQLMQDWNEAKNDPPLSETEVEVTVRSAYRNLVDGRRYGCASLKELDLCVGKKCKLYR